MSNGDALFSSGGSHFPDKQYAQKLHTYQHLENPSKTDRAGLSLFASASRLSLFGTVCESSQLLSHFRCTFTQCQINLHRMTEFKDQQLLEHKHTKQTFQNKKRNTESYRNTMITYITFPGLWFKMLPENIMIRKCCGFTI